jgi:TolB protein
MIATIGLMLITEYVLEIVSWGAIAWLLGLVIGATGAGLLSPWLLKRSQRKALILGRQIGIFEPRKADAAPREVATAQVPTETVAPRPDKKPTNPLLIAIPVALVVGALIAVVGLRLLGGGGAEPTTGSGDQERARSTPAPSKSPLPGGKIVFFSGDKGQPQFKIFAMDVDSAALRQLTHSTERDLRPSWSPDGSRIAFTRGSADAKRVDIYLMGADGSNVTQITKTPKLREYGSVWSPDGTKLLTTISDVSDMEGKTVEIAVVSADGSSRKTLTSNRLPDYDAAWSPDGSKIAFIQGRFEFSDVMVMDADGSNTRKLTKAQAEHANPAWSPDGRRIAYTRGKNEVPAVWVMSADGSDERQLTPGREPVWSPDGEWIMFTDGMELHVIRADGSDRRQITTNGIEERSPAWLADR